MENNLKKNTHRTESLCCIPKTNTKLCMNYINYSSIFFFKGL